MLKISQNWPGRVGHGQIFARRAGAVLTLAVAILVVGLFGCRDELGTDLDTNLPPDTYITGAPAESTTSFYKVHLYWYGDDADGKVVGFEYVITDSMPADEDTLTFAYTTRSDSIFAFPVEPNQQVVGHRFYVRAIDDKGAEDPEPAITFFGVADLIAPTPVFELARAYDPNDETSIRDITSTNSVVPRDTIHAGWDVKFQWSGFDADSMITEDGRLIRAGEVMQYEYQMRGADSAPILVDREVTEITYDNLGNGVYVFELRAVDDAGFMGLDPQKRTFVWNYDPNTYFFDPRGTDLRPRVIVTSDGWEGERVFFAGDTIPMIGSHRSTYSRAVSVNVRFDLWGTDPDDALGSGVGNFQYRKGVARYEKADVNPDFDASDPLERDHGASIFLEDQTTTSISLYARCFDGYGQPDGSAANFPLYINRGPVLLDTLDVIDDMPILQYPNEFAPIPMDSVRGPWANSIPIRLRAFDPDSTTNFFAYQMVISPSGGALYGPADGDTDGIFETWLELPQDISMNSDTLLIRVSEVVRSDNGSRHSDLRIPLTFVDN